MTLPVRNAHRATCLLLAAALTLSGCVTTGARPDRPSQQQDALYNYAESFPAQAAIGGALLGAVIGCAAGALTADSDAGAACATYGAVGAVGGAAIGGPPAATSSPRTRRTMRRKRNACRACLRAPIANCRLPGGRGKRPSGS